MAVKIALLAAFCVAQAFAFPPSFEAPMKEAANAPKDMDISVVLRCFAVQKSRFASLGETLPKVAAEILEDVDEQIEESARKYFQQMEEPVAKIAAAANDLYNNVKSKLQAGQFVEASEALQDGMKTIGQILASISEISDKAVEETEALSVAANLWLWNVEGKIADSKADIRKNFGSCLADGRAHLFE